MAAGVLMALVGGCSDSPGEKGSVLPKPIFSDVESTLTTLRVSWNPVANAASYAFVVSGGDLPGTAAATTETQLSLDGLTPGTEYLVRVKAVPGSADFRDSEYAEAKVSTRPVLPQLDRPELTLPDAIGTSATVTWQAVEGAAAYDYELTKGGERVAAASVGECACTLANLEAGSTYRIRVRAVPADTERFAPSEYAEADFTTAVLRSYAVGDFYDFGGVRGIVYEVDPDSGGTAGKVISLDETVCAWSARFDDITGGENGNSDRYDGSENMALIRRIADWKRCYVGFAWVEEKNVDGVAGWYVPSYNELTKVFEAYNGGGSGRNEEARAAFNEKLTDNGGVPFRQSAYWTSTQMDMDMAYVVKFSFGNEPLYKNEVHAMRAVHKFPAPENPNPNPGAGIIPFSLSAYEIACDRGASRVEVIVSPADAQLNVGSAAWCSASRSGEKIVLEIAANGTGAFRSAEIDVSLASDARMKRRITLAQGQYAVGDFYDSNGVQGVVCAAEGEHGTLLSLDETQAIYSREVGITIGAHSWSDGRFNCEVIRSRENWQENYPAFAWCDAKNGQGEAGWYLPAVNELMTMYDNYTTLNRTIGEHGGTAINSMGKYWASNEYTTDADFAWLIDFGSWTYEVRDTKEKTTELRVRAFYRY